MPDLKTLAFRAIKNLKLPPQLTPSVPLIELTGKTMLTVSRHRGLTEYTARRICARSSIGMIAVTGSGLHITQMNRQLLTISGTIDAVSYSEGGT